MKKSSTRCFTVVAMVAACSLSAWAGPITTVPWNGHPGAATFSFDDGLASQTQGLTFLKSMQDVSVTFFVCTGTMGFASNPNGHLEYAKLGHEIGNHTVNHQDLTKVSKLTDEIDNAATTLRNKHGQEATSLATPYCAQNQTVKNAIDQQHFISRGCGGGGITSWDKEPDWMQIDSHYWQGGKSTVNDFKNSLNQAANGNWHVMLNHGVNSDWDVISTNDIKTLIEYAVSKNLWVASFSKVGAYLRAHYTIDKAAAVNTSDGFRVTWTSPHAHMPKSVPLRVNIQNVAGRTVSQKGKVIAPNSDGSYTIEFMALELNVTGEPPEIKPFKGAIEIPGTIEGENYDTYAYEHAQGGSDTTGYRSDDAGIVKAGAGLALGYTTAGDFFEYTLDVKTAGKYKVSVNGATGNAADGVVTIAVGSKSVKVAIKSQGDWNTYSEIASEDEIELAAGKQTLRLTINDNNLNVDWIKLASIAAEPIPESSSSVAEIPAESSSSGTDAIATGVRLNVGHGMVKCSVFDMNGNLVKSTNMMAGSVEDIWMNMNSGLREGAYVLRYGVGKSVQTVRVRK